MRNLYIAVITLSALALTACAREESRDGVIPEGYKSAVEKAQGVEGTLNDAMQKQAEEMEERDL